MASGNDGYMWIDDVDRVEPPPQTNLEDREVQVGATEYFQGG
jgi:hypothetical protein